MNYSTEPKGEAKLTLSPERGETLSVKQEAELCPQGVSMMLSLKQGGGRCPLRTGRRSDVHSGAR